MFIILCPYVINTFLQNISTVFLTDVHYDEHNLELFLNPTWNLNSAAVLSCLVKFVPDLEMISTGHDHWQEHTFQGSERTYAVVYGQISLQNCSNSCSGWYDQPSVTPTCRFVPLVALLQCHHWHTKIY